MSQQKDYPQVISESVIMGFYLGMLLLILINALFPIGSSFIISVAGMSFLFLGLLSYDAFVLIATVLQKKITDPTSILLLIYVIVTAISAPFLVPMYVYYDRRKILRTKKWPKNG
jgi:hypothetical protein